MAYRTPAQVKEDFRAHPRRALILTTIGHESRREGLPYQSAKLMGEKGAFYEYGRFS